MVILFALFLFTPIIPLNTAANYLLNKLPLQSVNNHKLRHYIMSHDR